MLVVYWEAVVVNLLNYIYINKLFYTSKVCFWILEEISNQAEINTNKYQNIKEQVVERDNNSNIKEK